MSYPALSRADARSYLQKLRDEPESSPELNILLKDDGTSEDWDEITAELVAKLSTLQTPGEITKGDARANEFEKAASILVHAHLPYHPALADPEFWTWLAVTRGHEIIDWRYGKSGSLTNFGAGPAGETFFFRLWLRADIGFDGASKDSYALAKLAAAAALRAAAGAGRAILLDRLFHLSSPLPRGVDSRRVKGL